MTILTPRTTTKTIYQGDDYVQLRDLRRAAEVARRVADDAAARAAADVKSALRLGDEVDEAEIKTLEADARVKEQAFDAFLDEAAERAVSIELRAIGRRRFRDLLLAHPPRTQVVQQEPPVGDEAAPVPEEVVHPDDAGLAVNTETFPRALLTYIDPRNSDVRTISAPAFKDVGEIEDFLDDELSDGDFPGLWAAAYYLNRAPTADPQAARFFARPPSSSETSR